MACLVEVRFTPAEFRTLCERDLSHTTCVVFDVLRATSTIVTALAAGARGIFPVSEIAEALAWRERQPEVLLAGERDGLRISGTLAGGVEFDFGNSPREFVPGAVSGKLVITTTTNGTRALRACAGAEEIVVGSILNLSATIRHLAHRTREHICLVCAGTGENAALEDTLAAGAVCDGLTSLVPVLAQLEDSACIARGAFLHARNHLADALGQACNAQRLLRLPELRDDVEFCIRQDVFDFAAASDADGWVRRLA
jgi:2-phosphosulfolactate phosphatase